MSRQLRIEFPGAIWHITSRGNERRDIYRDDLDRQRFLSLLAEVIVERRWILHAWVMMSNHYHLLVETPEVGLSRGVKHLNQEYASWFNWRHERVGHLFQGRFKSVLVERESHLLELTRYIVLNPVRAEMVPAAGDYEWSNYRATAGLAPAPPWLEVGWTLAQFGTTESAARDAYMLFVGAQGGAAYRPWNCLVGQVFLGNEEFCDEMQQRVNEQKRSIEHPRVQREFVRPSFDAIVQRVETCFQVSRETLTKRSRGEARKALAHLAIDDGGLTLRVVAEWMSCTPWAVSKLRQASASRMTSNAGYRKKMKAIRRELS